MCVNIKFWAFYWLQKNYWDQFGAGYIMATGERVNVCEYQALGIFKGFKKIIRISSALLTLWPLERG